MKLLLQLIRVNWSSNLQYRLGSFVWMINGLIIPLFSMSVWLIVGNQQQLIFSRHQIITYYLLSMLIHRLTQSWAAEDLVYIIKDGLLSKTLLKPISLYIELIAKDIATKAIRLVALAPALIILIFFFKHQISISPQITTWAIFLIFVSLGYLMEFLLGTTIGLLAFWLEEGYGAFMMYYLVKQLLSGALLPLALMPHQLSVVSAWLPFKFMIYYPVEILTADPASLNLKLNFGLLLCWCCLVYLIRKIILHFGIKNYSGIGI